MEDGKNIPQHVAIIMDGNRRWARSRGLPVTEGHKQGFENFKKIAQACFDSGVKILTVFAFSTENWNRSETEVSYLMKFLLNILKEETKFFTERKIKMNAIGQIERFPKDIKNLLVKTMEDTKDNKNGIVNITLSYGGRQEIVDAVKNIIKEKIEPEKISEKIISEHLYTKGQSDPDLVIRTSGEMRLSGFLPWQSVYSELYFSEKMWPDFNEDDLNAAFEEFQNRKRRFGK